jgi:hypothetical protein
MMERKAFHDARRGRYGPMSAGDSKLWSQRSSLETVSWLSGVGWELRRSLSKRISLVCVTEARTNQGDMKLGRFQQADATPVAASTSRTDNL